MCEMVKYDVEVFCGQGGRQYNEDSTYAHVNRTRLIAIVADGLGMHGGGDIASQATVETIQQHLEKQKEISEETIRQALEESNQAVLERQTSRCKMKSTAVLLVCDEDSVQVAHLGDSRIYCFRTGNIIHQSIDHSVSQMAVFRGEISAREIRFHEDRNRLLRAMGSGTSVKPDIATLPQQIEHGDSFLLCTDGFWEYVTEEEMMIDRGKSQTAQEWMAYLLARIGERIDGKNDNLSAIAVICNKRGR